MVFRLSVTTISLLIFSSVVGVKSTQKETVVWETDGGSYACVDIYKQPSLNHPLLQNHKIQMRPDLRILKKIAKASSVNGASRTEFMEKEGCPPQTVPIRRRTEYEHDIQRGNPLHPNHIGLMDEGNGNHFAGIHTRPDTIQIVRGAEATMSIWNPAIKINQSSGAEISVENGEGYHRNYIKAGWVVNPKLYGDKKTRLYTRWRGANGNGCYNTGCPGFIITSNKVPLDLVLPISKNDVIRDVRIIINQYSKRWWLIIGEHGTNEIVGYWPSEIFSNLAQMASKAMWGGQIYFPPADLRSLPPPVMGNTQFEKDWYKVCAYFKFVAFYGEHEEKIIPDDNTVELLNAHGCYKAGFLSFSEDKGFNFLYGGPLGKTCVVQ